MITYLKERLLAMLFIAPVMLPAIICHECAHGWVSWKLGDPTAKNAGRLTLNPIKHIDPIGAVCMLIFHVGWAKPVPVNSYYYKDTKKGIVLVSLAGPVVNFILALLSMLLAGMIIKFGTAESLFLWILYQLCYYSAVINIGLGIFNLIPIPPLDGSNVLGALSEKVRTFYQKYGRQCHIVMLICVVTGIISFPLEKLNQSILNILWKAVLMILRIN